MAHGAHYTEAEKSEVIRLRGAGMSIAEIAQKYGRSAPSVRAALWSWIHRVPKHKDVGREKIDVPEAVWAARNRRLNEDRSLSEILLGDPPRSQSALGK